MKVKIEYQDAFFEINQQLANMANILESEKKNILTKGAKIIKASLIKNLPSSEVGENATNYNGTPYVHMKDDIKTSIKTDNLGNLYANIRGGKYTGYKWHLVNNGTSKMQATHFVDKTMEETANEIDNLIDQAIRKAVN